MGIGLKKKSWKQITQDWKSEQRCNDGDVIGTCCEEHHWNINGPVFEGGRIITTPEADKWIEDHSPKQDDYGDFMPTTERGKRRAKRRDAERQGIKQ